MVFELASAAFSGMITIQNAYMDGNSSVWNTPYGGCTANTQCNADIAITQGNNNLTIKYSVLRNFAVHQLSPANSTGSTLVEWSWVEGWAARGPDSHSEWFDGGQSGSVPSITLDHTVMLPTSSQAQFGPSPIFWSSNYPFAIGSFTVSNNTIINSFIGAGTKTATTSGCIGASFSGGSCTGAGSIYFATSITGTIGTGQNISCTGGAAILNTPVSGSYPSGVVGEWNIDGFSANQFWDNPTTPFTEGPFTCTSVPMTANTANVAVMSGDANSPFGSVTVSGNAIDPSSQIGATNSQDIYAVGQVYGNQSITGTITTSGGVSTLTTATTPNKSNMFVVAASITGCGGNNLGCPTITGGSGGSYTLSAAVTPVTSIPMTLEPFAWCTTPASFSGNFDMSGLSSTAVMNQWSTTTSSGGAAIGC